MRELRALLHSPARFTSRHDSVKVRETPAVPPFVIDVAPRSGGRKNHRDLARSRAGTNFFHVSSRVVNAYGTVAIYGRTSAKTFGTDKSRQRAVQQIFLVASLEIRGRWRRWRCSFGRVFLRVTRRGVNE